MKPLAVTCCFFLMTVAVVNAQVMDSLGMKGNELAESLESKASFQFLSDSLKILSWSDSLKSKVNGKFSLDSVRLTSQIDSIRNLNLSPGKYLARLDSVTARKDALIGEVEGKKAALLSKTKGRLEEWKSGVKEKLGISKLSDKVSGNGLPGEVSNLSGKLPTLDQNIPGLEGKLPDLPSDIGSNIPGLDPGSLSMDGLNGIDLPEMPLLSTPELKDLNLSSELTSLNDKIDLDYLDNFDGLQDKIGGASEQLGALKNASSNPDQLIETTLENVDQFGAVKEQLDAADAIRNNEFIETAEKLKDPAAMKEEVKQVVLEKAVNHFAGKEAVLQEAMNKLAKYKNKYESLNSLSDIKNLPKNQMKGKPFRTRFIPGVAMQFLRNENLLLDINPYAGYRVTGRLNAGAGWNQRIGYSLDHNYFTSVSEVYGPRFFTEFRTWKGIVARAEFEFMNTEVPPSLRRWSPSDVHGREWVSTAFLGIKRDYRFFKKVRGTAFVMFIVYNENRKSPYGDVINSRFGFEFPLKAKRAETK